MWHAASDIERLNQTYFVRVDSGMEAGRKVLTVPEPVVLRPPAAEDRTRTPTAFDRGSAGR